MENFEVFKTQMQDYLESICSALESRYYKCYQVVRDPNLNQEFRLSICKSDKIPAFIYIGYKGSFNTNDDKFFQVAVALNGETVFTEKFNVEFENLEKFDIMNNISKAYFKVIDWIGENI